MISILSVCMYVCVCKSDNSHLLEGSLHCDLYKVVLFSKKETFPKDSVEAPPEDFNCEDNPLYKTMVAAYRERYKPEDLRKLTYHMIQVS